MQVMFSSIPLTFEQFLDQPENDLSKPENTCALFLLALNSYIKDKEAGIAAINTLRGPRPLSNYDIQFSSDRLRDKPYLPLAYFEGATPQNNYTPVKPYTRSVLSRPTATGLPERLHAIVCEDQRRGFSKKNKTAPGERKLVPLGIFQYPDVDSHSGRRRPAGLGLANKTRQQKATLGLRILISER